MHDAWVALQASWLQDVAAMWPLALGLAGLSGFWWAITRVTPRSAVRDGTAQGMIDGARWFGNKAAIFGPAFLVTAVVLVVLSLIVGGE